jgi:glycosyltransferase involved in cell wall biosynthesis
MNDKIRICIASYLNDSEKRVNAAFACVHSILSQTYDNYEIYIHHDGPVNDKSLIDKFKNLSNKITFIDDLERKGHWGYYHRHNVSMIEPHADWVLYTNDDNYYVPIFLERMMQTANSSNSKMVYCDSSHSHFNYNILNTWVKEGHIDMGSFISHMDLVKTTPWTDYGPGADGIYAEKIGSQTNPVKASGVLFVHN